MLSVMAHSAGEAEIIATSAKKNVRTRLLNSIVGSINIVNIIVHRNTYSYCITMYIYTSYYYVISYDFYVSLTINYVPC